MRSSGEDLSGYRDPIDLSVAPKPIWPLLILTLLLSLVCLTSCVPIALKKWTIKHSLNWMSARLCDSVGRFPTSRGAPTVRQVVTGSLLPHFRTALLPGSCVLRVHFRILYSLQVVGLQ